MFCIQAHADGTLEYQCVADKYKCNYCDQAFSRRAQLRQHEEYKHGVRNLHGSRSVSGGGTRMLGNNSAILRKRKIGNVRIIQLPNGDRTFQEVSALCWCGSVCVDVSECVFGMYQS